VVRDRIELPTFRFSVVRVIGVLGASRTRTCVAFVLAPEIPATWGFRPMPPAPAWELGNEADRRGLVVGFVVTGTHDRVVDGGD